APGIKITDKMSYGLGMFVEDLAGVTVLGHGGNNMGFSSDLWFLPDVGVGVVLLFNVQDTSDFRRVVKRRALELIFDAAPKAEGQLEYAVQRTKEARAEAMARLAPVDPELGERLAGRYADPNLGALVLAWNGSLWAEFGEYRSELLMQREGEGVTLVTKAPPLAGLPLVVTEEGGRPALALDADQTRYLFKAVVPQEATAQPTSTAGGR
ncbi:MAG: serine hydrolase, partial [Deltaproteobacteria bacterium]|nr:serine hydrolase [Deltaproteobacteria bacterium]